MKLRRIESEEKKKKKNGRNYNDIIDYNFIITNNSRKEIT
jgi:hypothetical protein